MPINASPQEAKAAAAAYDWQRGPGQGGAEAAEYAHCPGGAAGYEQYEAASDHEPS